MQKTDNKKILFLVTYKYPYNFGESFIENELPFLSEKFYKIYFINTESGNNIKDIRFYLPKNSEVIIVNQSLKFFRKLFSLKYLFFSPVFKQEIRIIKNVYKQKISFGIIKTLLISLLNGDRLFHKLENIILDRCDDLDKCYLYSYWCTDNAYSIAKIKIKYPQIKTFARAHRWDIYFEKSEYNYLPLRSFIFKNLDKIFSVSENGRDYILKKIPDISSKIAINRLGTKTVALKNFEENKNFIKIVSIFFITKRKRINLLINALSSIKDVSVKWYHIGEGVDFDLIKNYALKKFEGKTNIAYHFLGTKNKEDIYDLLNQNIDLSINVSSSEGIPVSIMEAMSFGIPVIATDVGGTCEVVNNDNGILLPSNPSAQEVADAIVKFGNLTQKQVLKYRQNAYNTWNEKYNAEKNYTGFVKDIMSLS